MLDAAQIFRQTVTSTRFDTTAEVGSSAKDQAVSTGRAMGYEVVQDADPLEELMDSMEELSMMFEEDMEKDISDRQLGETKMHDAKGRRHAFIAAVDKWMKSFPDLPSESVIAGMLKRLQNETEKPSARTLLKRLERYTEDPSLLFAMLDCMEEGLSESQVELLELIRQAKQSLESEKGAELRAGINLADEINGRATSPEEIRDLRSLYRGEVLGFTTPQHCFRSLLASRGAGQVAAAVEFLLAAASADMQATTPSTPSEELRRIMLDLQCVEVLKTVMERMDELESRMMSQFGEKCLLNGERMTGKVVDFTEQPFMNPAQISGFLSSCGLRALMAQLDFMTQLTIIFRMLSPRLFNSESDRFKLVDSAQEVLDGIVERAEDEEEDEEGGHRQDDGDDDNSSDGKKKEAAA